MLTAPARGNCPVVARDRHAPVLLTEVVEWLAPKPGQTVVDATLGLGGHAAEVLPRLGEEGRLIGIDRDPSALERASARLSRIRGEFRAVHGDHGELKALLSVLGVHEIDAVLFDLGVSSMQLDDPDRGFSFRLDGPLDMRMDTTTGPTAAEVIADCSEQELRRILWSYGEERRARAIARAIVGERERGRLERTSQLAALVERVAGARARAGRIHPATRTFQALRIAVNGEIDDLRRTIEDAVGLLRPGGRIVVIAFHSLEDRAAKRTLRGLASRCTCPPDLPICGCGREDLVRVLTPRAIRPGAAETRDNPRARSARLRAAEKI